eukprot:1590811-Alexandrium_andersonii.AAC.1
MSASLVGSEMCIRDSQNKGFWNCASFGRVRAGAQGEPGPRTQGQETVSYTHLTLPTICSV